MAALNSMQFSGQRLLKKKKSCGGDLKKKDVGGEKSKVKVESRLENSLATVIFENFKRILK